MKKRNLLITFDYELFLGSRSGRPENCVIQPTQLLDKVLTSFKTKGVFFVDTTYLLKLRELSAKHPSCAEDLKLISKQLVTLLDNGHYVFPHIHPHWLDAIYLPQQREFDLSNVQKYRFHYLSQEEKQKVFNGSMEVLQEILLRNHPHYKINAFRAGGWCIQPFSDFRPFFEKHRIEYDMSVISGLYQFSTAQQFDFTEAPRKPVYRFMQEVSKEDTNGSFIQLCGSVIDMPQNTDLLHRIHRKVINRTGQGREYGSGQGQTPAIVSSMKPVSSSGYDINEKGREFASLEKLGLFKLPAYLHHLKHHNYLHLISHPKMINRHQIYILRKMLESAYRNDHPETDYMNIASSYVSLN
ncbi:MAG: hypothetical protein IPJ86_03285 [Bacteroidetes bacterium]|nr:hypothetical protein [Bacteroidota bacterium]